MTPPEKRRDAAGNEARRRLALPPDAVRLDLFPRRLRIRSWAAAAAGGVLGLVLGRLHFLHVWTIPGAEGLFSMEPLAFHAFWLLAGVALGVLAAALSIPAAEKPPAVPGGASD